MTHRLRLALVPIYLVLCLLLGGASAAGYWGNMLLQLAALPIIAAGVLQRRGSPLSTAARQLLLLFALAAALILLQLVPLPPGLWSALPGRAGIADGFRLIGQPLPWLPLSLDPYRTIASALWLLPALAALVGILILGAYRASWLAAALAVVTIVSIAIGALQISGGDQSPWYFYEITNYGTTVGFFSNANHFATLMVATIPFLAAIYLTAIARGRSVQKSSGLFVVLAGTLVVIMGGVAINSSIAGIGLSVPVLAASLLMILSRRRRLPRWTPLLVALLLVGSVAAVFTAPFGNNLTSQAAAGQEDSRYNSFRKTAAAAADFMPLGSGIGTFQAIYRTKEDPAAVGHFYMNHAHSDLLELALETGVPGLLLLLAFLFWWALRTAAIWRGEEVNYYARAATIATAAIMAHSLVDYPLRTAAIGALFAVACALMADPRVATRRRSADSSKSDVRHFEAD
jgi:O-antigen ligase